MGNAFSKLSPQAGMVASASSMMEIPIEALYFPATAKPDKKSIHIANQGMTKRTFFLIMIISSCVFIVSDKITDFKYLHKNKIKSNSIVEALSVFEYKDISPRGRECVFVNFL